MKKFFNSISNKVAYFADRTKSALTNTRAEGYIDSGVKILIAVVIGALLLGGLYTLFDDTIMPTVTSEIQELFEYSGSNVSPVPTMDPDGSN